MDKRAAGDGTVAKALSVMDEVAGFGRPVRFAELLDRSPYPKATLYRVLQTLTNQNMLEYDAGQQCENVRDLELLQFLLHRPPSE